MGFRRKTEDRMASVHAVLDGYELPSFPHVVSDALGKLGDPDVGLGDVANVLELDPGVSVKILSLVNSAAMGMRNPVDSLHKAVTMLGRNQVESILISTAAHASVPVPRSPIFDSSRFWKAAACRAVIATSISSAVEPARRSETFTAALLQDMALPVLVDRVDGYDVILKSWYDGAIVDLAAEEESTYGWDHASVAAAMGARWDFPPSLLDAIAQHHDPDDEAEMIGVRLVADWHEVDPESGRERLTEQASQIPALATIDLDSLIDEALERVGEVAALFAS